MIQSILAFHYLLKLDILIDLSKNISHKVQDVTQQIYTHFKIYALLVATNKFREDETYVYEKKESE